DLAADTVGSGDPSDRDERDGFVRVFGRGAGHSTISTEAMTPSLVAAARTTARMARAVRPPRPMTLPMSSGATFSRSRTPPFDSTSVTSTESGSSTRLRAMYSRTSRTTLPPGSGRRLGGGRRVLRGCGASLLRRGRLCAEPLPDPRHLEEVLDLIGGPSALRQPVQR